MINEYDQMSKRVDSIEMDVEIIKERFYKGDKIQVDVVNFTGKIADQISIVSQKLKDNDCKFKEIEEIISPIKLLKSHWKVILWACIASSSLGFAFDGGVKSIVHVIDKYKIYQVSQNVMRNERNGG